MSSIIAVSLIILFVVLVILAKVMNQSRKFFSYNQVKWLFISYLFVLVASIIMYCFLPYENASGRENDMSNVNLIDVALANKINQIDGSLKKKEWDFEYKGNWIELDLLDDSYSELTIVIERKAQNDGKIDAAFYQPKSFVNDIDITDQLGFINLKLKKDTLVLTKPQEIHLEFTQFTKEFPITQFTRENWIDDDPISIHSGMLYLRIPIHLNIVEPTDLLNIFYVGDKTSPPQ